MDKSEFDYILIYLKEKGFKIKHKFHNESREMQFSKSVETDDKDITLEIHGEITYYVSEK